MKRKQNGKFQRRIRKANALFVGKKTFARYFDH